MVLKDLPAQPTADAQAVAVSVIKVLPLAGEDFPQGVRLLCFEESFSRAFSAKFSEFG